jgi:hypothetical protein
MKHSMCFVAREALLFFSPFLRELESPAKKLGFLRCRAPTPKLQCGARELIVSKFINLRSQKRKIPARIEKWIVVNRSNVMQPIY